MESRSPITVDLARSRGMRVEVAGHGVPTFRGHVRAVSADDLRAHFPVSSSTVPLGTQVALRFSGTPLRQVLESNAWVLERRDDEHHREYVFKLLNPEEIVSVLLPHIQKVGNRRGAVRIRPSTPIVVSLIPDSGSELRASLYDISATGASLRVSPGEEASLASATTVALRVVLPGRPPFPLNLRASIRERRYAGALVHLGLAFRTNESRDFAAQEQAILQYVFAACAEMQGKPLPGRFGSA